MVKVYVLKQCSTCKAAVQWLQLRGVAFEERAIRETPPSPAELRAMLTAQDGEVRRLFNTSGLEYRAQKLAVKLPKLSEAEALALLAANGSLVKRPFVVGHGVGLVGFNVAKWTAVFPAQ